MTDTRIAQEASRPPTVAQTGGLMRQKAPYLVVLALAVLGVAYTSIARQPLYGYWEFLALAIGVACVAIGWSKARGRDERIRIAWTQALHWGAFLIAMNIVLWSSVNTLLTAPATGLALLLLLALGTFVAGIHISAEMAFLGVALAVAVPAIAWFKQTILFLILIALAVGGIGMTFWSRQRGGSAARLSASR
jgi:hypothetical protein